MNKHEQHDNAPGVIAVNDQAHRSQSPHLRLGHAGEDSAAGFMVGKGYAVIARNWRHGHLELDLVCANGDLIVFVEVKTRRSTTHGGPAAGITPIKRRRLARAAWAWLRENRAWDHPCRFDVICLVGAGESFSLEWHRNALEFSETLDCRDTHWQCW